MNNNEINQIETEDASKEQNETTTDLLDLAIDLACMVLKDGN